MTQALDPNEAAQLFRAGTALAFIAEPYEPFVLGRWMNEPALCLPAPADPAAYFATHPVIVYGTYAPPPPGEAVSAVITIGAAGWTARGNNMAIELPQGNAVDLTVTFADAQGAATPAPGAVAWTSSDDAIASVYPDADDDTQAQATGAGEGNVTITAAAGGISATIDVAVTVQGEAPVSAAITAGEPYQPGGEVLPEEGGQHPEQGPLRSGAPTHPGAPGQGVRPGETRDRAGVRVAATVSRPAAPPPAPPRPGIRPGQPIQRPR
jgi:hypothetical protein